MRKSKLRGPDPRVSLSWSSPLRRTNPPDAHRQLRTSSCVRGNQRGDLLGRWNPTLSYLTMVMASTPVSQTWTSCSTQMMMYAAQQSISRGLVSVAK
ncbi:hypothetical protein RB213_003535 [Colletotrichum asianum]